MTISKTTASNPASSMPQPASDPVPAASSLLVSDPGLGHPPRLASAAAEAPSLPPRAELPATRMQDRGTQFLDAVRHATLGGRKDQRAVVDELLKLPAAEVGAIINSQDENGDSALHLLAKSVSLKFMPLDKINDDNVDLLQPLLLHGADPRLPNQEGKTPAQYVDRSTRVHLVPHFAYELAQSGPLNQERLERNHAGYAADPAKAQALAEARGLVKQRFRSLGRMFQGLNRLKPYLPTDSVRFVSGLPSPSMANTSRFFGPAEHARYSLFDAEGRVSPHVAQARRGAGMRDGNNLILRFEPGETGRPVLKGIVFPSTAENAAGQKRYQPHTTAYGGGPFAFAGEISADAAGRITSLSNKSGHNHTRPVLGAAVTLYLQVQGLLAEDFTMSLGTYGHEMEHQGAEAFEAARAVVAQRWQEIQPAARDRMAQTVAALEAQLQALGSAADTGHGSEYSDVSRQRAKAYAELKQAETEHHFLQLIGYDPVAGTVNLEAAPPRGSYRPPAVPCRAGPQPSPGSPRRPLFE
jgi:hypothetical protein